ncbi:MAG: OmpA family protein [Elusimicrobiota bacterium]
MKRTSYLPILVAAFLAAACATQKSAQKSGLTKDGKPVAGAGSSEAAPAAPPTEVTEASLRTSGDFAVREDLKSVPFDYDSSKLSDEALAILKANAAIIKGEDGLVVLVAGHCDERGTVAYNLALGQKRAKEVRDYYINLGVDGTRVATISFGKEQPICSESTDDCWSKNRRAETRAHVKK